MVQKRIVLYSLGSQVQITETITWLRGDGFKIVQGNKDAAVSQEVLRLGKIVYILGSFPILELEYKKILSSARNQGKTIVYDPGHIRLGKPATYPQTEAHRTMMAVLRAIMDADLVLCPEADQWEYLSKYNPQVLEHTSLVKKLVNNRLNTRIGVVDWLSGNLGRALLNIRRTLAPPNTLAERLWLLPERAWYVYISEGWFGVRRQILTKLPGDTSNKITASPGKLIEITTKPIHVKSDTRSYSIIVLTHNNLNYTRLCLESIFTYTQNVEYEVIVLDNASTDDTPRYLRNISKNHPNLKVLLSQTNLGFAGGNNRALEQAHGEILVLLNNDTVVTQNWLQKVTAPLEFSEIGISGPVTNSSPYENRIQVTYRDLTEMHQFADEYTNRPHKKCYEVPMLIFFCVAFRREVYDRVGPLDEDFRIGLFEDDDYSRRVQEFGYRIIYTQGAFVHHWGSATMSQLSDRKFWRLYHENRRRFEKKWQSRLVQSLDSGSNTG